MADHLVTTRANPTTCHRCQDPILIGLADGLTARVDATPLADHNAEIAALLSGLRTYTRFSNGELAYRDASRIREHQKRDPRLAPREIHAEHKCTRPEQQTLF